MNKGDDTRSKKSKLYSAEEVEIRSYLTKRGLSVGSDSSVSSTEVDLTKGSYLEQLRAKMDEAQAAKKRRRAPAKRADNAEYGGSFLAGFFVRAEEKQKFEEQQSVMLEKLEMYNKKFGK